MQAAVQSALFNRELLITSTDMEEEAEFFQILVNGESNLKIAAWDWLEAHRSWDATLYLKGKKNILSLQHQAYIVFYIGIRIKLSFFVIPFKFLLFRSEKFFDTVNHSKLRENSVAHRERWLCCLPHS